MASGSAQSFNSSQADRFQLLLNHSSDAIAEFDAELRYASVNAVWASWFGLEPDDLLGMTNAELSERWQSLDLEHSLCWSLQQAIQHVADTGGTFRTPHQLSATLVELAYTAIADHEGRTTHIFAISHSQQTAPLSKAIAPATDGSNHDLESPIHPECYSESESDCVLEQDQNLDYRASLRRSTVTNARISNAKLFDAIIGAEMPGLDDIDELSDLTRILALTPRGAFGRSRIPSDQTQRQAAHILQDLGFLKLVLDSIPQYIFWKDRHSRYLGCNRRWAEMAGLQDPAEVVGLTDADLPWTTEQRQWYVTCDRQVMETGVPMLGIKQSQRQANGHTTWRETSKIPIRDTDGTVIGLLGMVEDVTERKRAADLLKQSEAKYKKLAQQEELLNRLSTQIRNSLNLEEILQTVVLEVRQLLDADRVVIYEFDADWHGTVVIENVMPPWRSTLGDMGADNCFPDKMAEMYEQGRIRAIDDVLNSGLDPCHVDFLQQLQVQANLVVPIMVDQRLWGLLIAHACQAPRSWKETETELLIYLAGQIGIAIRQAQLYTQAKASAEESQIQALKLEQALHDLKQAQAQLIQTEKMSSLGQLVAGVAHEINNPMNFIYGNINHIEDYSHSLVNLVRQYQAAYPKPTGALQKSIEHLDIDFLIEDMLNILRSLRVGSERIRQIVLSLRNFSRLDESAMKSVDIHEGIDSTLLILQHRLKSSPTRGEIHVIKKYGELPSIECYPSQLNQVFMNIISNAIDALEELGVEPPIATSDEASGAASSSGAEAVVHPPMTISITTEAIAPSDGDRSLDATRSWVRIRVHNNGPAIPVEILHQLFDPFFTTKPIGQGTGLGLSISHQIVVQKHRGYLSCLSSPGRGVEFCIELPINDVSKPNSLETRSAP
ncbi:MAG: PAS domain-containing protein [Elainellaceae cyanobacterium]